MTSTLVDTNILIDILGPRTTERQWSLDKLEEAFKAGDLVIIPVIWSELGASSLDETQLTASLSWLNLKREVFSFEAGWLAGKAHRRYRLANGQRERTLPDFMIGAHAAWRQHRLLTRDAARYRSYFPGLDIIAPETHP